MKKQLYLLILCALMPFSLSAVEVTNLYKSEIILPAEIEDTLLLSRAFRLAAQEVLVKVTGQADRIDAELMREASLELATWIEQHAVENVLEVMGDSTPIPAKKVTVSFYEQSVLAFLTRHALPVWGSNRPSILLWLVQDDGIGRQIAGVNQPTLLLGEIAASAGRKGLPIYAPLLDEVDKKLSSSEVWGFFESSISEASKRYQTDLVVAARVDQLNQPIQTEMLVLFPNEETVRVLIDRSQAEKVADSLVAGLAATLSNRYAAVKKPDDRLDFKIQISGITSYAQLDVVQQYFDSISLVNGWYLSALVGEEAQFVLQIDGDAQKLMSAIALDRVLGKKPLSALDPNANKLFAYDYLGR